jgi:hypothetical protein
MWVVDRDGGEIGRTVVQGLLATTQASSGSGMICDDADLMIRVEPSNISGGFKFLAITLMMLEWLLSMSKLGELLLVSRLGLAHERS